MNLNLLSDFSINLNTFYERKKFLDSLRNKVTMNPTNARDLAAWLKIISNLFEFVDTNKDHISNQVGQLTINLLKETNNSFDIFFNQKTTEYTIEELLRAISVSAQKAQIINIFATIPQQEINNINKKYEELIDRLSSDSKKNASEITYLKNQLEDEFIALKETVDKYKETAKADTTNLELTTNSRDFSEAARKYYEDSIIWRYVIIGITITIIGIGIWFLYCCWLDTNCLTNFNNSALKIGLSNKTLQTVFYYEMFKKAAIRIFILSLVVYLLKFSIKNFSALKHNYTINNHKANCLQAAVRILALLPSDDKSREAILKLASKEIFTHYKTGYLNKDEKLDLNIIEKIISMLTRSNNK